MPEAFKVSQTPCGEWDVTQPPKSPPPLLASSSLCARCSLASCWLSCCRAVSKWPSHPPTESPVPRRLLSLQSRGDESAREQGHEGPSLPAPADRTQLVSHWWRQPRQQVPCFHWPTGRICCSNRITRGNKLIFYVEYYALKLIFVLGLRFFLSASINICCLCCT